jgi:hypothetical protein
MEKKVASEIVNALAVEINNCFHWINEFNILFPEGELQYELYNKIAPNFFSNLSKLFFDIFILTISKMLDKPSFGGFENLSLLQIPIIAKGFFPEKEEIFSKEIEILKKEAKTIILSRNKIIAHRDLNLTLNKTNIGITTFEEIKSIILKMAKLINSVLHLLEENEYSFIWLTDSNGSTSLLKSLKESYYYRLLTKESAFVKQIEKLERDCKYNQI